MTAKGVNRNLPFHTCAHPTFVNPITYEWFDGFSSNLVHVSRIKSLCFGGQRSKFKVTVTSQPSHSCERNISTTQRQLSMSAVTVTSQNMFLAITHAINFTVTSWCSASTLRLSISPLFSSACFSMEVIHWNHTCQYSDNCNLIGLRRHTTGRQ